MHALFNIFIVCLPFLCLFTVFLLPYYGDTVVKALSLSIKILCRPPDFIATENIKTCELSDF